MKFLAQQAGKIVEEVKKVSLEVVGIGRPCIDVVVKVAHLPGSDESLPILDYTLQGGGKVPTALVALARLGGKAGLVGKVGRDSLGRLIIQDLINHGIDTTHLCQEAGTASPFSVIISDSQGQGRSILWERGTVPDLTLEEIHLSYLWQAACLHLAASGVTEQAVAHLAREKGLQVIYDADFYEPAVLQILPNIDVLIASREFADAYAKRSCASYGDYLEVAGNLRSRGPTIVVITLGQEGAVACWPKQAVHQPAFQVPVVDTTGAGDVFHGAFISGLLQAWPPEECTRFASAVAALKTTGLGGRAAIPTLADVKNFLATGEIRIKDIQQRNAYYKNSWHSFTEEGGQHESIRF